MLKHISRYGNRSRHFLSEINNKIELSLFNICQVESLAPLVVAGGGSAGVARVRLRPGAPRGPHRSELTLRTNLTDYTLPLLVYSGELRIEWEWPHSADGALRLGALGTSSTRRVGALLHNDAPAALCVRELSTDLAGATLALQACAHLRDVAPDHSCVSSLPPARGPAPLRVQ